MNCLKLFHLFLSKFILNIQIYNYIENQLYLPIRVQFFSYLFFGLFDRKISTLLLLALCQEINAFDDIAINRQLFNENLYSICSSILFWFRFALFCLSHFFSCRLQPFGIRFSVCVSFISAALLNLINN